jgi:hypothetical protein
MTAHDLIASIFSRVQPGVPGHERRITLEQLNYLESLIGQDDEGSAYKPYGPEQMAWAPSGRTKFIICRSPRKITKMANLQASASGRLF